MRITRSPASQVALAIASSSLVAASALTTVVPASSSSCFYTLTVAPAEKIGVYFAVQSGGEFDIDFSIVDPNGKMVLKGEKEKQGDYIFTASAIGEYAVCFNNEISTFADKVLDFDIMTHTEPKLEVPDLKQPKLSEKTTKIEDSIVRLRERLDRIQNVQKYFRTRENRNSATVLSTQSRIFWYSIIESAVILGMSAAQVQTVKFFFRGSAGSRF